MSDNLDEITTDVINLFNNRSLPALFVSQNPKSSKEEDIRCKYTGSLTQLFSLVSSGTVMLADMVSKEFNLPKDVALEVVIDAIKDQVDIATAKNEDL